VPIVDAVVIGAGPNGLVAANMLADAGWDVLLCEASEHIGGAVRSAEITAPGFSSDLFSAFYPLAAASPVIQSLGLADFGLSWTHAPQVLAHLFPDDQAVVLSRDLATTAASVERFGAGDGQAWQAMVELWARIEAPMLDALMHPLPAPGPVTRLLRTLGPADALRLARMAVLPVRRLGQEWFSGPGAPILLAGNALHADLPPEGAGSGIYGWLLCMLGQRVGFPVPVGGAQLLSGAMAARLQARGGQVRTSAPVVRLELRGNGVRAVILDTGERIETRRAVIADVPAPVLYTELVGPDQLPARLVEDIKRFQWDAPTMKLNWALRAPIPWSNPEVRSAGTVHLGVDLDGLTRYAGALAVRRPPPEPFVLMGQMTTADASRSPAGTESAWAYTHLPHGCEGRPEVIAGQTERVETLIERHAPGFTDLIIGRAVQSPSVLAAENPSLRHGAINGGTAQLHQQLVFRPIPGLGGASTPIDRLFLGSSSAHPGGGVHGACGANAAVAALRRNGRLGSLRRRLLDGTLARLYRD